MVRIFVLVLLAILVTACEPEVGSEEWCEMMDKKPKGDWSFNETGDYAKHCVIK